MKPALVATLAVVTACVMYLTRLLVEQLDNCPEGYEDEEGFHFGR